MSKIALKSNLNAFCFNNIVCNEIFINKPKYKLFNKKVSRFSEKSNSKKITRFTKAINQV